MSLTARQTERVIRVLLLADREAVRAGDSRLGTAHLLLALALDERDHGGRVLAAVDVDAARDEVARRRTGVGDPRAAHRPHTPGAVAALDAAVRVADAAADPVLGVRHLLLGVLADDAEDAAAVLRALGVDVERVVTDARRDLLADRSARPYAAVEPVMSQLDRVVEILRRLDRRLDALEGGAVS
ncbi:Clp protease N-terminal domain-containing protein [Actinomycetospora lemnae]|uniref:Clp protease N-terminal domain-containing protein n=1 Tax=Actinomycetospora lemnae TaxID=3019891 RepID=A0ABT5ST10_9PSEU|nr:Clp protease N-terminal domain-containing protein [Actinomycetospora sp. DW7H6]MDD7965984.1 Clp protease N-terminal domain-containing protein [Actinomycetospora sp. DW7H6]